MNSSAVRLCFSFLNFFFMSSRRGYTSKSTQPRVTIVTPDEEYDPSIMKENIPPKNESNTANEKRKSKKAMSLASKFSRKWEQISYGDSFQSSQSPSNSPSQSPSPAVSPLPPPKTFEVSLPDDIPSMEIPEDDYEEPIPQTNYRNTSNQSAETILQEIDSLVNRVREICGEKGNRPSSNFV